MIIMFEMRLERLLFVWGEKKGLREKRKQPEAKNG
jgi:hypothetical protein